MTASEAKKIHARMYADVQVIVRTIEEIEQVIFEIVSSVTLPIENCINPNDVLRELRRNRDKLIAELHRLNSVALGNHIQLKPYRWEYNTEKAPEEIINEFEYNPF